MGKKFLIRDELHFFHKALCIQISKEIDDSFASAKTISANEIAATYTPPHELKEILRKETEEKERKELEEAEKKRNLEIEREQN